MRDKAQISVKTKKILLATGIVFGTILLFVVSFFLSLYFIINPIKVSAPDNGEIATENQELKTQIKTLEDEIERLNVAVDKNKSNINPPAPPADVNIPTVTTPSKEIVSSGTVGNSTESSNTAADTDDGTSEENEEFSPETVVTPEGGYEPEAETDVTIIDISE